MDTTEVRGECAAALCPLILGVDVHTAPSYVQSFFATADEILRHIIVFRFN